MFENCHSCPNLHLHGISEIRLHYLLLWFAMNTGLRMQSLWILDILRISILHYDNIKRALIRNIITITWFLVETQINESKQRSCLLSYVLSPHCGTKFVYKYLTNISKIIFFLLGFNHWIFKDGKRNPKDYLLRMPYSYCKYLFSMPTFLFENIFIVAQWFNISIYVPILLHYEI